MSHGECSRDWCGCHDELVWCQVLSFFAQQEALCDTKPVLLIDDREAESMKDDVRLKEGMSSNHHLT